MARVKDDPIAESLRPLAVDIDSVSPYPGNPRQGDIGAIVTSLRRFGQLKPVVVQKETGYIVAGNHVWKAAKDLGWEKIAAVVQVLSDWEARAFLIADNRMSDLGTYDEAVMASILKEIAEAGDLLGTGFDGDDVDEMLAKLASDEGVRPQVEFTDELMERQEYVVFAFDNDLDWNVVSEAFGLGPARTPDSTDTYNRVGTGRIVKGEHLLRLLKP